MFATLTVLVTWMHQPRGTSVDARGDPQPPDVPLNSDGEASSRLHLELRKTITG